MAAAQGEQIEWTGKSEEDEAVDTQKPEHESINHGQKDLEVKEQEKLQPWEKNINKDDESDNSQNVTVQTTDQTPLSEIRDEHLSERNSNVKDAESSDRTFANNVNNQHDTCVSHLENIAEIRLTESVLERAVKHVNLNDKNKQGTAHTAIPPSSSPSVPDEFTLGRETKIRPPCYCMSCSSRFWNPSEGGFEEFLSHEKASAIVQGWIQNISTKSASISQSLQQYGRALRRYWVKKKPDQRRVLLIKAYPSLMTYSSLANLLAEHYPRTTSKKVTSYNRLGLLTSNMILDDLVDNEEILFQLLDARAEGHPSSFFLADLKRIEAVIEVDDLLRRKYIFGTFGITCDSYGKWHRWQDRLVHRFETLVAPYSFWVFESQSEILNALFEIISEMTRELPRTATQGSYLSLREQALVSMPTISEFQSLYMRTSLPDISLDDVIHMANNQLDVATSQLARLRSDNEAFIERMRACRALQNTTNALEEDKEVKAAYWVLAEPHDRVIAWNIIHLHLRIVARARGECTRSGIGASIYARSFAILTKMLDQRSMRLIRNVQTIGPQITRPGAVVPKDIWRSHGSVMEWFKAYFFAGPFSTDLTLSMTFMQKCFQQQAEDVRCINDLVKEWIEESLVIMRLLEIMFACEPTILSHPIEPLEGSSSMWQKLYQPETPSERCAYVELQGEGFLSMLRPTAEYILPKGRRDAEWREKYHLTREKLNRTWKKFTTATIARFEDEDFAAVELELVKATLAETEPHCSFAPDSDQVLSQSPTKATLIKSTVIDSSIPHHSGPITPVMRKLTRRQRDENNSMPEEEKDGVASPTLASSISIPRNIPDAITEIAIKSTYVQVVESLFSNAQQQVTPVRWEKFLNFMNDAGCTVRIMEGASHEFTSRRVQDRARSSVTLHKPHPDTTLRAVHLRNFRYMIVSAFGWRKELFVVRK